MVISYCRHLHVSYRFSLWIADICKFLMTRSHPASDKSFFFFCFFWSFILPAQDIFWLIWSHDGLNIFTLNSWWPHPVHKCTALHRCRLWCVCVPTAQAPPQPVLSIHPLCPLLWLPHRCHHHHRVPTHMWVTSLSESSYYITVIFFFFIRLSGVQYDTNITVRWCIGFTVGLPDLRMLIPKH